MYIVITNENGRQVGVGMDGSRGPLDAAPLFATEAEARVLAAAHGGKVEDDSRVFGDDMDDIDFE